MTPSESRIEPPAEVLDAARRWLQPVRAALGAGFKAAFVTGSALRHGFSVTHSHVNLLVLAETLDTAALDRIAAAVPATRKPPHFDPLFMTHEQVLTSLDVFPIEWLDVLEHHVLLEGVDVFAGLEVPRANLRLQCEHELRGKHLRLRHAYLAAPDDSKRLAETLARLASGFLTLFRTLLRLRGETPPPSPEAVVGRVAEVFGLDAKALIGAHLVRHAKERPDQAGVRARYAAFMTEIERLVGQVDALRVS